MTIVVGVVAPDGVVLAADSRTTTFPEGVVDQGRHRILSDTAEKLFTVCGRYAVATYGDAFVNGKTIAGLMDEFAASIEAQVPESIDAFVGVLGDFFHGAYGAEIEQGAKARVGFLVAGYDDEGIGHIREVFAPGPHLNKEMDQTTALGGACWRGQTDVINRLLAGVDWNAIAATGEGLPTAVIETLNGLEYDLLYPVTLQDAVDFASFLIRTTVDMQRFSDGIRSGGGGVPGCGGETKIVALRRDGVEWVHQSDLTPHRRAGWAEGSV